jgi:hypothetical protein
MKNRKPIVNLLLAKKKTIPLPTLMLILHPSRLERNSKHVQREGFRQSVLLITGRGKIAWLLVDSYGILRSMIEARQTGTVTLIVM